MQRACGDKAWKLAAVREKRGKRDNSGKCGKCSNYGKRGGLREMRDKRGKSAQPPPFRAFRAYRAGDERKVGIVSRIVAAEEPAANRAVPRGWDKPSKWIASRWATIRTEMVDASRARTHRDTIRNRASTFVAKPASALPFPLRAR